MKKLHYHLVDVFTDRAFGGNPLAVFTDGTGISADLMQSIAKELNLSETTFVLPPELPGCEFRVRIFTPADELPMAGHPTIGTAFVLGREGRIKPVGAESAIVFEEGVGPVPVRISWSDGAPAFLEMTQPLPVFGPRYDDVPAIAEMLSLNARMISETQLPVEVVSCGVPYLIVPIADLAAIGRARLRPEVWDQVLRDSITKDVYLFTQEVVLAGSDVHSRMFAPAHGITEDPATGSASGPLGCYFVRYEVRPSNGQLGLLNEQGVEMGRPSLLSTTIQHTGRQITEVRVGGTCQYTGSGCLEVA